MYQAAHGHANIKTKKTRTHTHLPVLLPQGKLEHVDPLPALRVGVVHDIDLLALPCHCYAVEVIINGVGMEQSVVIFCVCM